MDNSSLNESIRKVVKKELQQIFESINLPIEIGDEILTGRFKNKKTIVKTIDKNEKGDLIINGKPMLKFRTPKKIKIVDKIIKK